jgi:hypothetical protein
MKTKKVFEFQQGQDPYKIMRIGSHRKPAVGDRYRSLYDLTWSSVINAWGIDNDDDYPSIKRFWQFRVSEVDAIDGDGILTNPNSYFIDYKSLDNYFQRI